MKEFIIRLREEFEKGSAKEFVKSAMKAMRTYQREKEVFRAGFMAGKDRDNDVQFIDEQFDLYWRDRLLRR